MRSRAAPLRVGVLVSGQGTNLVALLAACQRGSLPAQVVLVGCNRADAPAIGHARAASVPVCLADRATQRERADRQRRLRDALQAAGTELVVLAGFDEICRPELVAAYPGRMINVHPSLLPSFGGSMHAIARALERGVKVTGCTVHLVTDETDAGPILLQKCVAVRDDDTEASLRARIQAVEHVLLPEAVRAFAQGRVRIEGTRAHVVGSRQRASHHLGL